MAAKSKRRKLKHKTHGPPLSMRQIRFCQLFFDTDNATRSYIDAGLHHKNENSAGALACYLLRNLKIREYIQKLRNDAFEAAQVTVEELANDLRNIKNVRLNQLVGKNGEYLHPHQWPDHIAKTVESIEIGEVGERGDKRLVVKKVKVTSKMAAIAKLAEWKRMVGQDKSEAGKANDPLVVEGDGKPSEL